MATDVVRSGEVGGRAGRLVAGAVVLLTAVPLAACTTVGWTTSEPTPSGTLVARSGQGASPDEVRLLLEHDGVYRRAALGLQDDDVPVFCGIDVMGESQDGRFAYVWASCSTFTRTGDSVEHASGVSGPVLVDRSFGKATVPGDGSRYAPDVRSMFPAAVAERMLAREFHVDQDEEALRRRAAADPAVTERPGQA